MKCFQSKALCFVFTAMILLGLVALITPPATVYAGPFDIPVPDDDSLPVQLIRYFCGLFAWMTGEEDEPHAIMPAEFDRAASR